MAPDFVFDEESITAIAAICRRLDGIPLAIEIAASRATALGVVELSKRLDDQFRVMTSGFRTTLPRHRTLQATFDWSYNLLTPAEQRGLQRLAIAVGRFTLDMAKTLLSDGSEPVDAPEEIVAGLVEKSLVVAEYHYYAALTRAALCKLASDAERAQHLEALGDHHRHLAELAVNCPENFENRAALVGAEIARVEGRAPDAMNLYEQAIRSAQANGFVHNEALASELAGLFYATRGLEIAAHGYLRNARYCYLRW
jgi:predicted ATPase